MTRVKESFYGRVRRTAYDLWDGPDYLMKPDDENPLSGFCLLRLAMRQRDSMNPQIESRAVYASLAHDPPSDAILRAIYWDSQTVLRKNRHDPPATTPFKIPAKFVQIAITQVRQWVKMFDGLQTSVQVFSLQDDSLPICSLRIATDYVSSVFEKVWQVPLSEQHELTRVWQDVWQQMGQTLQTAPSVAAPEEFFPCVEGKPEAYDLQAYEPVLTLS